jgi:KDO2-lipid IV(A) lauroyltransferase
VPGEPLPGPPSKRPRFRHRIEYLGYRVFVSVLRITPERPALLLGEVLGWLTGVVFRVRWRTVQAHLEQAFPEKDWKWRRRVAKRSFRHLGRESVATFRLGKMDLAEVKDRLDTVGFDEMKAAFEEGRGLIVLTGHYGNWEIAGASNPAFGIPLEVIAQRQRNPLFDVDITKNRHRLGMTVIERRYAPKRILKTLREGGAVGIVADQNVRRDGVFVDFFGRPASTARGPAVFALRTGCPVFVGVARRKPGFPQRYDILCERVDFTPSGDLDRDVIGLTEAHTRYLEKQVRKAPEQYFWQHRRWKTRPPDEEQGPD